MGSVCVILRIEPNGKRRPEMGTPFAVIVVMTVTNAEWRMRRSQTDRSQVLTALLGFEMDGTGPEAFLTSAQEMLLCRYCGKTGAGDTNPRFSRKPPTMS